MPSHTSDPTRKVLAGEGILHHGDALRAPLFAGRADLVILVHDRLIGYLQDE